MELKQIILENIAWVISGVVFWGGVLTKMFYDIRGNKQRADANAMQIKELEENHKEFEKMSANIEVIKNDIGWMKEQISENSN